MSRRRAVDGGHPRTRIVAVAVSWRRRFPYWGATGALVGLARLCFGVVGWASAMVTVVCAAPRGMQERAIQLSALGVASTGAAALLLYGAVHLARRNFTPPEWTLLSMPERSSSTSPSS